jgi:hypothetical protein
VHWIILVIVELGVALGVEVGVGVAGGKIVAALSSCSQ